MQVHAKMKKTQEDSYCSSDLEIPDDSTQGLQCSSFLVMTYSLLRDYNILPKKELPLSPWVITVKRNNDLFSSYKIHSQGVRVPKYQSLRLVPKASIRILFGT